MKLYQQMKRNDRRYKDWSTKELTEDIQPSVGLRMKPDHSYSVHINLHPYILGDITPLEAVSLAESLIQYANKVQDLNKPLAEIKS